MKISIGCDHGGYDLKESIKVDLLEKGVEVKDFGCYSKESVDYPEVATAVTNSYNAKECDFGILICSTGIGISIAANKANGIRAALCGDVYSAEMTRRHNNANVLCLGAQVVSDFMAKKITDIFLNTEFEGDRHERRVNLIHDIEKGNA